MQGHGRIIAHDFYVAHREANSGLSALNRTKSILSIYHQQRQLQKQRGMCLNDTYPFCQQPLSGNCHSICFSKPVLWTATSRRFFFVSVGADDSVRPFAKYLYRPQCCGLLFEQPSAQPVGEGRGGEHVPEECHGEVLDDRPHPDDGQLPHRCAAQDHTENDGGHQGHGRTHDQHSAALPHKAAEKRVVLFRITHLARQLCAQSVAPQLRHQNDDQPHEQRLRQRLANDAVG